MKENQESVTESSVMSLKELAESAGFTVLETIDEIYCNNCYVAVDFIHFLETDPWIYHKTDCPLLSLNEYKKGEISENVLRRKMLELESIEMKNVWNILPENFKKDEDFLKRLPCYEHYNQPWMKIHIDGPPPAKYRCSQCYYKYFF